MSNQKYVSRLGLERNYAYAPGHYFGLDWQQIKIDHPTPTCRLVALDDRQIELIYNLSTVFPHYYKNWGMEHKSTWTAVHAQQWDEITAFVAELEYCLMAGCDMQDFIKSQRMITAALVGESVDLTLPLPDTVDYTVNGISPVLQAIAAKMPSDMSLQELIDQMTAAQATDPTGYGFKDYLEILTFIKQLVPLAGAMSAFDILAIWQNMKDSRFKHTTLTMMGYQSTALRGIQNALAPFDPAVDEEAEAKSIWERLDLSGWLTTAIVAVVDPSPVGEIGIAFKIGRSALSVYNRVIGWYTNWRNYYINQVGNPVPITSVTGAIADLMGRLVSTDDTYGTNLSKDPSIFGMLQKLVHTQVAPGDEASTGVAPLSTANRLHELSTLLTTMQTNLGELTNLTGINADLNNLATLNTLDSTLEALRTTLETRSVAETTAQNTNFADLGVKLDALNLTAQQQNALTDAVENILGGSYVP